MPSKLILIRAPPGRSSELRILYSLPSNLTSVPPYRPTSRWSPFFISNGTFLPLSSVFPVPRATTRLSMGFSLAVSGITIPPFLTSFASTASTRMRSPRGLMFSVIICRFFSFLFSPAFHPGDLALTASGESYDRWNGEGPPQANPNDLKHLRCQASDVNRNALMGSDLRAIRVFYPSCRKGSAIAVCTDFPGNIVQFAEPG